MKYISELPEPYKSLAEKRREEYGGDNDCLVSYSCFHWASTLEGDEFWDNVCKAKTEQELPPIPETE